MECKVAKLALIYGIVAIMSKKIRFLEGGSCRNPILVNISDQLDLEDLKVDTFQSRGLEWTVIVPINNNYFFGIYQDDNILFQASDSSCEKIFISRQNITDLINNPITDPNVDLSDPQILDNLEISPVIYKNNSAYNNMVSKVLCNVNIMNMVTKNIIMERIEGRVEYFVSFLYLRVVRGDGMDTLEKFTPQYGRWVKSKISLSYSDNLELKHYAIFETFNNLANNNNGNNNEQDNNIDLDEEDNG